MLKDRAVHKSHRIRKKFAEVQTLVLISLAYFLFVPLFTLMGRRSFRSKKGSSIDSYWSLKKMNDTSHTGMKNMG
jgi:hypothetical protein